ncbi:hypothetical protein D3C85_1122620 [compost metagenome]
MYLDLIGLWITDGRDLLWLNDLQAYLAFGQTEQVDGHFNHRGAVLGRQQDHTLHQIQYLQAGVQTRLGCATLQVEDVAQVQHAGIVGTDGKLAQVGRHLDRSAALLQYLGGGVDELARGGIGTQQLLVIASADANINGQLVEVTEQVDLSVGQALPAQQVEIDVATQWIEQGTEQCRLTRIDFCQGAANTQYGLRWFRGGGDSAGAQGGGVR